MLIVKIKSRYATHTIIHAIKKKRRDLTLTVNAGNITSYEVIRKSHFKSRNEYIGPGW
jgi:hypothetical protein